MKPFFAVPVLFLAACTPAIEPPTNLTSFKNHGPSMVGWNTSYSELCSRFYTGGNEAYKIEAIKEWYVNDRFFERGYADGNRYWVQIKAPDLDKCDKAVAIVEAEFEGKGLLQSDDAAISNFEVEANNGNAIAQNNLGLIYSRGRKIPRNYSVARKWFTIAAEQGFALAQNNLGDMYANNRFVAENYEEGLKWYRLAASQGNIDAQFSLGRMYYYGQAVDKDYERSLMWYSIASKQGHYEAATVKQRLEKKMTKEAIEKARKLANDCTDNSYKNC
ncbi:sel1 repeat family protein [Sneathiella sp. CAU 1612]|uniref:Sel1 repeat family protein n=1 Tax=Sneathiella sedimenti TaxID=2816034 RepID=A0ABS3F673_9PROT|nr:tetratricopeptide repeat protein [Sneathiella sedimenti]MBO0334024.1 sel1 repeat family protein [Sneathiella sedimenti]